jgi:hypothetical protein
MQLIAASAGRLRHGVEFNSVADCEAWGECLWQRQHGADTIGPHRTSRRLFAFNLEMIAAAK